MISFRNRNSGDSSFEAYTSDKSGGVVPRTAQCIQNALSPPGDTICPYSFRPSLGEVDPAGTESWRGISYLNRLMLTRTDGKDGILPKHDRNYLTAMYFILRSHRDNRVLGKAWRRPVVGVMWATELKGRPGYGSGGERWRESV